MTYIIHIKNNITGEIRKCIEDDFDDEFSEFWWSEGGGACDCNRQLAYNGYVESLEEVICGDSTYSIVDVHLENGERNEEMNIFLGYENG
jgi:hypothetical protein